MRAILAFLLLTVAAVAGCTQSPETTPTTPPPTVDYVAPVIPAMDAAALLSDLQTFAGSFGERRANLPTHEGARQWLLDQFDAYGLDVWRQNFTTGELDQANIVGIHWGQVRDQVVVVGAHYDTTHDDCTRRIPAPANCAGHKASQGAYDDGSGVLIVAHLAKAFATVDTYYTIAFVEYDGEERGLEGAYAFAGAVTDGTTPLGNVTIRSVLDVDMFGITWPGTAAPIQVLENSDVLYGVFDAARLKIGVPDDMVYQDDVFTLGSSDFQVYMDLGIPTIFFDSDFGKFAAPGPVPATLPAGVYPFWHMEDRYETMIVAAGSPANLEAGFQTAADVTAAVLHAMATDRSLELETA